jgi:hypothetical protein
MRSHESKIGPPPQLGHRSRIARQNSIATRRRKRHMAEVYRVDSTAKLHSGGDG